MFRWRTSMILLCALGALMLLAPAVALAGGSAGDQQYVDPLSGSHHSHHSSGSGSTGTGSTGTVTPTATTPTPTASSSAGTPTATTPTTSAAAATTSTATADPTGKSLPYTGVNTGLLLVIGFGLVGSGVIVRRVARRSH